MEFPTYEIEDEIKAKGFKYITGVDEVARGTLVGSVVAAAVVIPDNFITKLMYKVNDSKKLSPKKREKLYDLIINNCNCGVGIVSNETIDEINILEATKLAMYSAITQLDMVNYALIDGNVVVDNLSVPQQQIIKGDNKSISIASASIIAKVTKDRIMDQLHEEFPMYHFNTNRGYGTKKHIEAIKRYGITKYHRKSFGICRKQTERNMCIELLKNCRSCKNNKANVGEYNSGKKIVCYKTDYPEVYRDFLEGPNKKVFERMVGAPLFPLPQCEFYEKLDYEIAEDV